MDATKEKQFLRLALADFTSPGVSFLTSAWLPLAAILGLPYIFFALFQFSDVLGEVGVAIACAGIGNVIGAMAVWRYFARQWFLIKPHINRESIARRLSDLEP